MGKENVGEERVKKNRQRNKKKRSFIAPLPPDVF
jgi:hypothetical protein